jgi:RND family efflux transporter MFP subunit
MKMTTQREIVTATVQHHASVARRRGLVAILAMGFALAACSTGESNGATPEGRAGGTDKGGGAGGNGAAAGARGAGGGGGGSGRGGAGGGPTVILARTDVATVERGTIEAGVAITGDLRPIETIDVKARLEGDLVDVYVREGQRVTQGQLLARFEASEQESERRSAEAERASARSSLATAQWNAEQSDELFKAGAIPERDARTARQAVDVARAQLAAAEARVRMTSSTATDTRVLAPTSGVVDKRLVENGEHVARGASMFSVVRSDVLELAASVPARFANDVRAGQTVHFAADGRRFDGRVARVSPTVDPTTRAVTVYVQVPNADGSLKGNSFASGRVIGRTISDALLVPAPAIRDVPDSNAYYAFRVTNGQLARTPVTIGIVDDARAVTQVVSGLQAGDRVVVGNVGTLGDRMKVQIVGEGEREGGSGRREAGAARP